MKRTLIIIIAALALAAPASAANWPLAQLDQIGTALSGKPVNVYCESSWLPWESFFAQFGQDGTNVGGFTYPFTGSTLFVSPKVCEHLHAWFANEDIGTYDAAQAILVLTHESLHQRLHSADEAVVECNALKLFPSVATNYFRVALNTSETYVASVVRKIKVGKKIKRITVPVIRTRTIANPYYTRLVSDAGRWDAAMPAQYHGATC